MTIEMAALTSKGQLTVPIAIRKKLNLKEGDKVVFIEDADGGIHILNASALSFGKAKEAVAEKG